MRKSALFFLATLALAMAWPAHAAIPGGYVSFTVTTGDQTSFFDVVSSLDNTGLGYEIDSQVFSFDEGGISISGYMDTDPYITYSIAVTDFGAPSTYTFTFLTPIVPVTGPNEVRASISGGFTDATGNGFSFTPVGGSFAQLAFLNGSTNMGVDVGPAFSAGSGLPGSFYTYTYNTGYGPTIAGPSGTWNTLSTTLSFTLSGGNDSAAITGYAEIIPLPVPEPSSIVLLFAGLMALGVTKISRRPRPHS